MSNVEPKKIYVKFIPKNTTNDEVQLFFRVCGKVTDIALHTPKSPDYSYMFGFVIYETQAGANRAVIKLNGQVFKNGLGHSQTLFVTHAWSEAKQQPENTKDLEKKGASSKEYNELMQIYQANEEKIKQIYNNQEEEKETNELRLKISELEAKQIELRRRNTTIKEGNNLLHLELKIKNLEKENSKLKGAQ